jgi:ABC-type polysaccharide/polyol phosphate export permease
MVSQRLSHFKHPHFTNLVRELTRCEFKLRDQSTLLGFLWTLLHPALMFGVLYALFVKWMGNRIENFGLYLILGVVQWNYFVNATTGGLRSIVNKSSLISNFVFPQNALVVSAVTTSLLIHFLELAVMLIFFLAFGAKVAVTWLMLPALVLLETVLILGVSFYLARMAVQYRDAVRIWEILTTIGFFLTPVFFPLDVVAPERRRWLLMNPMARIIEETRKVMIYDQWPSWEVLGTLALLAGLLLLGGYRYFKKGEPHFAEKFP